MNENSKRFKILVIGDSCTDVYVFGKCKRLSFESPVPILKVTRKESRPGMASNVVKNLTGLGHEVEIICNKERIEKKRVVDEDYFHHLLRVDTEPDVEEINLEIFNNLEKYKMYDAFVISDYCKGFLTQKKCKALVEKLITLKKPIFVDSKKQDISCFKGCIIKINEIEFKNASNEPKDCEMIVTLGKRGAMWRGDIFPSHASEIDKLFEKSNNQSLRMANVCGAGDTFFSGLVDCYLQTSGNIKSSIEFANKCASICIDNFGTYSIKRRDIKF